MFVCPTVCVQIYSAMCCVAPACLLYLLTCLNFWRNHILWIECKHVWLWLRSHLFPSHTGCFGSVPLTHRYVLTAHADSAWIMGEIRQKICVPSSTPPPQSWPIFLFFSCVNLSAPVLFQKKVQSCSSMSFCHCRHPQISAVRLPREPSNPERLKGFGYAEFDDVESLLRALSLSEEVRKCSVLC